VRELATAFESATGHKLVIRFGTTPELIKMAATGGHFDLAVVPVDVMKDAPTQARFAAGETGIARVGLGVAVRAGAPKPDIRTPEALKKTLLEARSIASIPRSATGYLLARVLRTARHHRGDEGAHRSRSRRRHGSSSRSRTARPSWACS
jgi:molybdate transport system substrate-binding protein